MAGYPGAAHRLSGWYPHRSGSAGLGAAALLPARVGFESGDAEGFEPGEQFVQPPVVVDPGLVVAVLVVAEPAADGFRGDFAGPLPVGAVPAVRGGGGRARGRGAGGGGAGAGEGGRPSP